METSKQISHLTKYLYMCLQMYVYIGVHVCVVDVYSTEGLVSICLSLGDESIWEHLARTAATFWSDFDCVNWRGDDVDDVDNGDAVEHIEKKI